MTVPNVPNTNPSFARTCPIAMRLLHWGFSLGLFSSTLFPVVTARGLLAIDYGTQFMKLSLIQPGIPFDVLLNHDSKRKTQAVVSVRGEDKLIGDDAATLATRYPQNSYPGLKLLLGQPLESPAYSLHQSLYNIPAESTPRGTIKLVPQLPPKGNTTITYLPEELVALQFSYARELADAASAQNPNAGIPGLGGEKITDCIITVPGFFNQFERKALLDGAELAGLKVLGLIDDGASFGVNYAMMRTFGDKKATSKLDDGPGVETHLIYDFGASSIKATVIEFSMFEEKIHVSSKIKKNVTMVDVKGYGHQRNMGGLVFDRKIRDILKKDFQTQTKIDVSQNDRAMTKLLREATRVKQVLSANAESQSRIEGLVDEHDFKSSLTRQAFEDACAQEIPQFTQPILDALENAKMSMADIKSVILVGGSSRVPMVQAAIKSLVGEDRIAVNVNADEAAVMGAALYGAGISRQFKTKDVRINNVSPHSITASYNVTKPASQADPDSAEVMATKTVTTTLFQIGSKLGGKKVIKMKKSDDFSVQLNYINQPLYFPGSLLNVTIHGISAALLNYTNVTGLTVPLKNTTVKLVVGLDESELVVVPEATLTFPTETSPTNEGTIANKIAGFFGGSNKEEAEEAIEEVATDDDSSKTDSKPTSKDGQNDVEKAKEALKAENAGATDAAGKKQKVENMTIKLTVTLHNLGIQPMSTNDRIASGKFLRELKAAETRKRKREEARNALEAYTYKLRDRLEQEVFQLHGTEQEIDDLKLARNEVSDWVNDWAEQAPLKELRDKKQKLEKMENPIQKRIIETKERPALLERFNATLVTAQSTLMILKPITEDSKDSMAKYTAEEINGFAEMLKAQTEWFEEISRKVADLDPRQDPPTTIEDLESRQKMIQGEMTKLVQKKAPRKKPKTSADQQPYSAKPSTAETNKTEDSFSQQPTPPDSQSSSADPTKPEGTHSKDEL